MALDTSGFNSEQQTFGGLYKLGDNLERNRYRKEQEYQKNENTKTSNSKYLNEYFDPKEYLTGSIYDKQTTILVQDALNKAQQLNKQGLPLYEITMAVSPLVNKANRYVTNGKLYNQQKKSALEKASKIKGIDASKLSDQMDNYAFPINPETGERDVELYNPNENYADKALNEGQVYNNEAFDEFMKGAGKNTRGQKLKLMNSRGGYESTDVDVTSPDFMIPESDELGRHIGFEPKHKTLSTEHEFITPDGVKKSKVKILDDEVINSLPEGAKGYLRQEAHRYADMNNINRTDPRVEDFYKAMAYDEVKRSEKLSTFFRQKEDKKDTPIKIYTGGGGSKPTEKEKSRAESASNLFKTLDDITPNEKGDLDVTDLFAGINILSPITKKPLKPEFTGYNPKTKVFTFMSDGVEEKIPYHKMYSLAATANSGIDKDWFSSFEKYSRSEGVKNEPAKPKEEKKGILGSMMNWMKKGNEASREKPKTVKQNGVIYTWNEKTKQYE